MNIKLYHIEGISRIDTPSFNTKTSIGTISEQEIFFDSHLVKTIEHSFYPPHYQDVIKFDIEDLDINDNVNYLSLEYMNKTFYYFIDDINYVSDGIIELSITMDVIQTYMFNIKISSGIIERKFINRWYKPVGMTTYNINRNYLRENVSSGNFELYTYTELNNDVNDYWIITKESTASSATQIANVQTLKLGNKEGLSNVYGSVIRFGPYVQSYISAIDNPHYFSPYEFLRVNNSMPEINEEYIIPFNPFDGISRINSTGLINISNDYEIAGAAANGIRVKNVVDPFYTIANIAKFNSVVKYRTYSFNFERNTLLNYPFNSSFMPCLLDENYIHILFGSRSNHTTFPLYKIETGECYCMYYADVLNGSRCYYIAPSITLSDKYKTMVIDTEPIKLDLLNDTWAQYNATNKYRWLQAIGGAVSNIAKLFTKIGVVSTFAKSDINEIAINSLTPKRQKLSKKGARAINSIRKGLRDEEGDALLKGVSSFAPLLSQEIQDANILAAPDSVKQTGSTNDILNKSCIIFLEIDKVNDYEQCAQYFHRNGNLVNEYVSNINNIFAYVRNRYYFDMLKMSIPEVHLNIIEDETTCDLIKERLNIGLRLWNVRNPNIVIGNFQYDNLENDFL